jgi:hypothetical protein
MKRGLSDVVSTLLIVLLVLISVGIVWVVINNFVKPESQIGLEQFTLNLAIENVLIEGENVVVTVKNSGGGDFVGMNFVFSDNQNSEIIREDSTIDALNTKTFTFTLSEIDANNLKNIAVFPIFRLNSGDEISGNPSDIFEFNKGAKEDFISGNFVKYGPVGVEEADYSVDSSEGLPKFTRILINPLDVHVGDNQTFTAYVSSDYEITEVITRTQLDNELLILPLEKISEGVYSATWTVYDTHTQVYRTNFTAKDSGGNENTVAMSWTDPCTGFTHGQASTVDEPCTISTIDGVDNGNIILATGGTITINPGAYLSYTPGFSIIKSGGSLVLDGSITKQYIFYTDSDSDGYGSSSTYTLGLTPSLSGYVRPVSAMGNNDCNDTNSSVNPGQTSYFEVPIAGTSSFDYNCDGQQTPQSYTVSTCTPDGCGLGSDDWTEGLVSTPTSGDCGNDINIVLGCFSTDSCNPVGEIPSQGQQTIACR